MADKEATIYIVDLGSSMARCRNGRTESDLDWSMQYVWDRISTTVAASRKTWNVGVIGLRTDTTDNPWQGKYAGHTKIEGYENISLLQELGPMTMSNLISLRSCVKTSNTMTGDCISAIVVAIEMIVAFTKKLKYNRRIILVTDGEALVDNSDIDEIARKMKSSNIQLTVLGVDFDDAEFGVKEEDKSSIKKQNESILKGLVEKSEGLYGTIAEAISELETPRIKPIRAFKAYEGLLTLGDPKVHADALSINVERYFKTHKANPPSTSRVVMKTGASAAEMTGGDEMEGVEPTPSFAAVKDARTYKVNDPDAPGGRRDVERDELARGYMYGRTAVHISEAEFNITKIETTKCFSIVGFIHQQKYEPFLSMGDVHVTVAQKFNELEALKLSSLIHSLHELESYAVARLVGKDGKDPVLLLLAPHISHDFECLYDIPLPFAEDVRDYAFAPIGKVVTLQGNTITQNHRNLPSRELQEAMDDYVDSMDISSWGKDDEGNRTMEYAAVEDIFSPPIHRVNQVIKHRAIYPDQPIPPTKAILLKYANPPEELLAKARSDIEDLIDKANVKKVPPKAQGKRNKADKPKPISGLNIDELLRQPGNKRENINPNNAIAEFKQKVEIADMPADVEDAIKQMGTIVRDLVTKSFGDQDYDRVIEHIGVMRETVIEYEYEDLFNSFMRDFKVRLLSGEFNGNRRELWWQLKNTRLGLIDNDESGHSSVTLQEAIEFLKK